MELIPITKGRGKHIALKLVRDILCRYGSFKKLITDNGSQYQSKVLQAVLTSGEFFRYLLQSITHRPIQLME